MISIAAAVIIFCVSGLVWQWKYKTKWIERDSLLNFYEEEKIQFEIQKKVEIILYNLDFGPFSQKRVAEELSELIVSEQEINPNLISECITWDYDEYLEMFKHITYDKIMILTQELNKIQKDYLEGKITF